MKTLDLELLASITGGNRAAPTKTIYEDAYPNGGCLIDVPGNMGQAGWRGTAEQCAQQAPTASAIFRPGDAQWDRQMNGVRPAQ